MKKIGFVGLGKMGSSILEGITNTKQCPITKSDILLYDKNSEVTKVYSKSGYEIAQQVIDVFKNCHYILLAIKPQSFPEFYDQLNNTGIAEVNLQEKIIISICAGISSSNLAYNLACKELKVIRIMPNTPVLIGCGTSAIAKTSSVSDDEFSFVVNMFNSVGTTQIVLEEEIDTIIPLNGSMPAYLYLFAKSFIDEAVKQGIEYEKAKKLCCEAIIGSAKMILQSDKEIDQLIRDVCSPKGTTLAGLEVMNNNLFSKIIEQASIACTKRSKELTK